MLEPSNEQREAIIRLMAEVWDDFVSDTGCFPDDFTILPRRRLQFVAGRWSGMVADALYALDGPLATALAEARAEGRRQGLEEAAKNDHSKDFQLMMVRIIQRHRNGRDLTETLEGAADLLKRKGSLSPFRATAPAETQKPETGESTTPAVDRG